MGCRWREGGWGAGGGQPSVEVAVAVVVAAAVEAAVAVFVAACADRRVRYNDCRLEGAWQLHSHILVQRGFLDVAYVAAADEFAVVAEMLVAAAVDALVVAIDCLDFFAEGQHLQQTAQEMFGDLCRTPCVQDWQGSCRPCEEY